MLPVLSFRSEGYPVVMFDGSGHNAVCNRTALKKAGLINDNGEKIKDIRGGEYTVEGLPEDKKHGNIIWAQEELDAIVAAANNIGIASNLIWHMGDPLLYRMYFLSIMPEEIYESGYPMKSLMDAGIVVSSSTDAPCGESVIGTVPNIIGASVDGLSPTYLDVEPLNPDELLTERKVLKCLTINGAASLGLEKERGSIEVGKYAGFVVLDKDVLELEAQDKCKEIFKVNVSSTWFEGKQVYQN